MGVSLHIDTRILRREWAGHEGGSEWRGFKASMKIGQQGIYVKKVSCRWVNRIYISCIDMSLI